MAEMALSEARRQVEKERARRDGLLSALEVLEGADAASVKLGQTQAALDEATTRLANLTNEIQAVAHILAGKKVAANDEVAAERVRLQQELAKARTDLAETQRQRREEHDGRERETRTHNAQRALWAKDDDQLRKDYALGQVREREALGKELATLRRQVESAKADLADQQKATRELAEALTRATAPA